MGMVFKAKDTRLDRLVAIKTLRPESTTSPLRKQRFVQEARAASALNHPNITHIYDIGSDDGTDYIAMEYVQGQSLEQMVKKQRLPWQDVVEYAVQIADALEVAHQAGILHRDLKPGNVMVTDRRLVKVLDFGLAKLMEPEENRNPELEVTRTEYGPETVRGTTVGTPRYMSPEQAAGKKLDARSDIFSLGTMLYQMATGSLPFAGDSTAAVLASILRDEPQPPGLICSGLPLEIERIILRCLRKDPKRRFQNMLDVKLALDDIQEEPGTITIRTASVPVAAPRRRRLWLFVAALLGVGLAAGIWSYWRNAQAPVREAELSRVTSDSGLTTDPAISLDGKLLAYASDRGGGGNLNLWVQQIGGGEPICLTHGSANDYQPNFSPDGTRIAFRSDRDGGGIYVVSALGGEERKIAEGGRQPRFSPDGKWIAYWTGPEGTDLHRPGAARMYVMDSAGAPPRELQPEFASAAWPVWSPDGKYLLFTGMKKGDDPGSFGWWVTPTDRSKDATQVRVPANAPIANWFPYAWQSDRVIFSMQRPVAAEIMQVSLSPGTWRIDGAPHRLTSGITREDFPSLSADGHLPFASLTYNVDIYSVAADVNQGKVTGTLQRVTQDVATDWAPSVSSDGNRLAFYSNRGGKVGDHDSGGIWTKDFNTGKEAPLVRPVGALPFLTPDGSTVAWQDGHGAILAMPFQGGAVRHLCDDCEHVVGWSADSGKILFSDYSAHSFAGVLDVKSGQRTILKHPKLSVQPRSFSPDGRWIAVVAENPLRVMIVPFRPGQSPTEDDWIFVTEPGGETWPQWSPNGNLLYFTSNRDGLRCIWAQALDPKTKRPTGEPFAVLHLHGALLRMRGGMGQLAVARNKLAFSLEERTGNIWMLKSQ